jgi:UDP-2,4-diacetamido-2,4,6-trideoxy-beta-L-altropyranose hydrolase
LLTGAHYALLKPEFRLYRDASLYRRQNFQIKHVMVSLGGIDRGNATSKILEALAEEPLPENCKITVVLGPTAPWTEIIRERVAKMPFWTELKLACKIWQHF